MYDKVFVNIEEARQAIRNIRNGFVWANTPQGHDYWQQTVYNIQRLIADEQLERVKQELTE